MLPEQFWRLTIGEFNALVRGHAERERRDYERALWTAWHTAAFTRAKRLPSLKELLTPAVTKKLTPAEAAARKADHEELTRRLAAGERRTATHARRGAR